MSEKSKWPRAFALDVARDVLKWLTPHCERVVIAGSLRRGKAEVGDIEFLFIPRMVQQPDPEQLFVTMQTISAVDLVIDAQLRIGELSRRPKSDGSFTWGSDIKLAIHECSGMPLDFFSASPQTWWCNLVSRTGPAQHNIALASAARDRGFKWLPNGAGFERIGGPDCGSVRCVHSEQDVFEFVGVPYLPPALRGASHPHRKESLA